MLGWQNITSVVLGVITMNAVLIACRCVVVSFDLIIFYVCQYTA